MEPFGDLLGDQGGVAAGAVVDDQVDLDLVLLGLVYDFGCVLDHFRIQHGGDHFVEREGFGIEFFVADLEGGNEPDDFRIPGIEKLRFRLGKLLPQCNKNNDVPKAIILCRIEYNICIAMISEIPKLLTKSQYSAISIKISKLPGW